MFVSALPLLIFFVLLWTPPVIIESRGFAVTALIYACIILPFFYLPFLVLRERPERQISETERLGFRQSVAVTLRNPALQVLTVAGSCSWIATTFGLIVVPYIVT